MLGALRSIVQEVNVAPDLNSVLHIIVARVKTAMTTEVCSVYLRNSMREFVLMATDGLNQSAVGQVVLALNEGLVGSVAAREEPLNLEDAESHPKFQYFPETGEERYRSFLGVPIIHQRQVLGVLVVQQREKRKFDEGEEAFLITMSAQLAAVIAHAEATGALRGIGQKAEARFLGVPGASGVSIGRCVVSSPLADLNSVPHTMCMAVEEELAFFQDCLSEVRKDVRRLASELENRLNKEERILFDAYIGMLDDTSLGKEVTERISSGFGAAYAWSEVILEHVKTFSSMSDPYLRERASDVRDLGSRVLAYLQEATHHDRVYPDNTILVGEDLSASVLADVPQGRLKAIVSTRGSSNSHIAILARSMGIPTVMGAVDLPFTRLDGRELIVDGYRGTVYIDPSDSLKARYQEILDDDVKLNEELESLKDLPSETQDHHRVALWVNTGLVADAMISIGRGAEGVGLYRTEIPFMLRDRFPSEEEQRQTYREQLKAFAPHPVTMRTLDIGGDKSLPYFPIEEDNPFLGWRGIRVTLDHPEIFLSQVRAMLKASEGLNNLRIMLPMVSNISELEIAQMLLYRAYDELREEGHDIEMPPLGVMIEVPAAVFQTQEFASRVDFLSVGSNDLTQYLLAVDRNNPRVADLYHSLHPAVLRALVYVVQESHRQGVPVSICGELAGDPAAALLLMAMGFDVLSMSASNLLKVKSVIRSVTMRQAEELLAEVMSLPDAESINRCIDVAFRQTGLSRIARPHSEIKLDH
ncbi:phosphoenolpyruvate--protein phosphotransferase [Teredinibacter waterburyi]|jgi:phosphoenolpyruvate-protein phosphotransferase|uniref:phosphoenolpyruvate--protein phosphotransferase n=1 Tax=Teredinibacter waterburyi TaxID=1500538 RepID=UPI00165F949B|nr:phosphoenolpyruvate--protein phosphotransferase [Teredinibacter waterburyi]